MNPIKFFIVAFFVAIGFQSSAEIPFFRHLQVDKENKNLRINVLFQDSHGYIWAGTDHGLYKYDGFNFDHVVEDSSSHQIVVTAIAEDLSGNIYFGTEIGELFKWNVSRFVKTVKFATHPIKSLSFDASQHLWVGTYGDGVFYSSGQGFLKVKAIPDDYVYDLLCLPNKKILAGTDLGLAVIRSNSATPTVNVINTKNGLPDNIVRTLSIFSDDVVTIGFQEKGVCFFDVNKEQFYYSDKLKNWEIGPVSDIVKLQNELWIGTDGNGIVDFEFKGDKRLRHFKRETGFNYSKIYDLLRDREGNVWISVDNKLIVTSGENIETISQAYKIGFDSIQAITSNAEGSVWFSNKKGLFRYNYTALGKSALQKFDVINSRKLHIVSLFEDDWGYLWIGTFDNGLYRLNSNTLEVIRFNEKDGLVNANVISISGKDNKIWLATLGGIILCDIIENPISPGKLTYKFSQPANIHSPGEVFVYDVFIDSRNRVWFGTDGRGISVYDHGKLVNYANFDNDRGKVVYSIVEDRKKNIWFSTLNHGLYRYDGKKFIHVGIKEGLRELDILGISIDNDGHIVVIHNRGLDLINPISFEVEYIGAESGIDGIDCDLNTVTTDVKGNTWIGTQKGLIRFYNYKQGVSNRPLVDIRKIYTFMKPGNNLLDSVFEYNQNQISIEFIGLWYNNPESITYRYRLAGFSKQWITTHDRIVTFPNLPPGNYTFEVEASNNNRFVNPHSDSYSFTILKPIWKRTWFVISVVLIISIALIWLIRDRENRLKRFENLKKEKMEYQYETLKSQVNPHFLFNSFNTLISIIDQDKDLAIDYVENLSDYFRNMIQYRDKDTISLKEELKMVNTYFYLQTKRFGENLKLIVQVPDLWVLQFELPPLSLQLLIENAVKHNSVSHETPLTIKVIATDRNSLLVSNNLNPKKNPDPSTGIGIENIISRFRMLTEFDVVITKTDQAFIVEVPLILKQS